MIKMIEDSIGNNYLDDEEYNNYLDIISKHNPIKLLEIYENGKDKTNINAERKLLFDAICYEIISYI